VRQELIEPSLTADTPLTGSQEPLEQVRSLGRGLVVRLATDTSSQLGVVRELVPNGAFLAIQQVLRKGSSVRVEFATLQLEAEVSDCRPAEGRFDAHLIFSETYADSARGAPRFPLDIPVQIYNADLGPAMDGRVVDLSAGGLGLETSVALPIGDVAAIENDSYIAFGAVRHCSELPGGQFRLGVAVYHVMPKG
jgi:PilZ domain-containing protein